MEDPGPYQFVDGKVVWDRVLQGDAFYTFLQIRALSYGDEYDITVPCSACNAPVEHTIHIERDLKIQPLSDASRTSLERDTPLVVKMDGGQQVAFRLLTVGDERKIQRIQEARGLGAASATLAARIVGVEGLGQDVSRVTGDDRPVAHAFDVLRWVEDLGAGDADQLREQLEPFDCGVETNFTITCGSCMYEQVVALPLQAGFFQRRKKQTVRETKQKSAAIMTATASGSGNTSM
jgi:hypothetical protein